MKNRCYLIVKCEHCGRFCDARTAVAGKFKEAHKGGTCSTKKTEQPAEAAKGAEG